MDNTARGRRLTPWLLGGLLVAAGCSSPHRPATSGHTGKAAVTTTQPAAAPGPAAGSAGGPAATAAVAAASGAPPVPAGAASPATMPAGFQPVSYTAVSPSRFWVLGTAACGRPLCTYIASSDDGGQHFSMVTGPPAQASVGVPAPGGVNTLAFADPSDGYAAGVGSGGGSPGGLWATHDGGAHWASYAVGTVESLTVSDGFAYAVVGDCSSAGCTGVHLLRAATTSPSWTVTPLPGAADTPSSSVTAVGLDLWVDVITASGPQLLASTNGGASFSPLRSPCAAGLGGSITAVTPQFLWAVCPTGTEAQALRSTDGGRSFAALGTGPVPNSVALAPADAVTAVLLDQATMWRTANGGAAFSPVVRAPATMGWLSASFVSSSVGAALSAAHDGAGAVTSTALWRTVDGGRTWRQVMF